MTEPAEDLPPSPPPGADPRDPVRRLFDGDHTFWRDDPTEISDRLGWIPVVGEVWRVLSPLREHVDKLLDGIDHVLLMGMGGSSLFPGLAHTDDVVDRVGNAAREAASEVA